MSGTRRRRLLVSLGVFVAVIALASTALAVTWGDVARYKLAESSSVFRVDDAAAPANDGWRASDGITTTGFGYVFEGWHRADDGTPGELEVDDVIPVSTYAQGGARYSIFRVKQNHEDLDPGTDAFRVILEMSVDALPDVDLIVANDPTKDISYNVAQKGLSSDPGGSWKIEIVGKGSNAGTVRCTFKGENDGVAKVRSPHKIDSGDKYKVICKWNGADERAHVYVENLDDPSEIAVPDRWTVDDCHETKGCPDVIEPGAHAYFGGKPGSTDPTDAYAGEIFDIKVQHDTN